MANEISITSSLSLNRSTAPAFKISQSGTVQVDQAAAAGGYHAGSQSIGTTEENLAKGDIATVGWVWVKNLDATNFVTLGTATGQLPVKILPGETAGPFRVDAANVITKADGLACLVEYLLIEA